MTFALLNNVRSAGNKPGELTAKVTVSPVLSCINEVSFVEVKGTFAKLINPSTTTLTPSNGFSSQIVVPFFISPNRFPPNSSMFTPSVN